MASINDLKNKTFMQSVFCGIKGLFYFLKTERNCRIYLFISIITLIINIYLHFPTIYHIIWFILVIQAYSAECINTIIEKIMDYIDTNIVYEIKIIKDMGSGAVLIWGIAYFTVEFIMVVSLV